MSLLCISQLDYSPFMKIDYGLSIVFVNLVGHSKVSIGFKDLVSSSRFHILEKFISIYFNQNTIISDKIIKL